MTHSGGKPHNVGDHGQRFEVRATGYPKAGENVIGWSDTIEGADVMAGSIRRAPSCTSTTIYDRAQGKELPPRPVITRFAGVLR
jgi:hypothetical protein